MTIKQFMVGLVQMLQGFKVSLQKTLSCHNHYRIPKAVQNIAGCILNRIPDDRRVKKDWAAKSGLGWIGKHSNLITKSNGSFYFIAELIIDLELDYDYAVTDHCGNCR